MSLKNVIAAKMPPHRELAKKMPLLMALRVALMEVRDVPTTESLSKLFDLAVVWQESGLKDLIESFRRVNLNGWFDGVIKKLIELQEHFDVAAREGLTIGMTTSESLPCLVLSTKLRDDMIRLIGDLELLVNKLR